MAGKRRQETFAVEITKESVKEIAVQADGSAVIPNCKLNGIKSENGSIYPESVLQAANSLYEGVKVFSNHGDGWRSRSREDILGRIKNPRWAPGGTRGDFHVLPSHVKAGLVEDIKADPSISGFSHVVWCDVAPTPTEDGYEIVTKIHKVESVDLVSTPATTRGMFESVNPKRQLKEKKMPGDEEKDPTMKLVEMLQEQVKTKDGALAKAASEFAAKDAEAKALTETVTDLKAKLAAEKARADKLDGDVRETRVEAALIGLPEAVVKSLREGTKPLSTAEALKLIESMRGLAGTPAPANPGTPKSEAKAPEGVPAKINDEAFLAAFSG